MVHSPSVGGEERRANPRVELITRIRVKRLRDVQSYVTRDVSAGGVFISGCDAALGEHVSVEFQADELPGVQVRASALVVRRVTEGDARGVGVQFEEFEEGESSLAKLIGYLLSPKK